MAREALGIVGAVVGAYYGGPQGAQAGFLIGSTIGGVIDGPEKVKLPGLDEAPVQTSRDGIPIPIAWGLCHLHGNLLQKNAVQTIIVKEKQGKGGGTVTEEERHLQTFAIGLGRGPDGPIQGISRIWEFDKLIYDVRQGIYLAPLEHLKTAAGIRIYLGDEAQLPDPDLEAETGVGLTPAYRGLAYIVFVDKDITDFGSAIPQYRFEINTGADVSTSSKIYPVEITDEMDIVGEFTSGSMSPIPQDALDFTYAMLAGSIQAILKTTGPYADQLDFTYAMLAGSIRQILKSTGPYPDQLDFTYAMLDGSIRLALISTDLPEDEMDITCTFTSGSMTPV